MAQIDLLLEAERRGILPPDRQALLSEARRRGLVEPSMQPSARQAEEESMTALRADPSVIPDYAGLEHLTGGAVTRPGMEMAGGMGGQAVGTAGGIALGTGGGPPGMAAGGLAGGVAGASLGAAAGSLVFDNVDMLIRYLQGKPKEEGAFEPAKRALKAGKEEALWTAAAGAAGPAIKAVKPLLGRAAGVFTPEAKRIADLAQAQGVDVGLAHVSPRKGVRGFGTVLGVFPFVGTPIRKGQARVVGQLNERAADMLNTLAPVSTTYDVSKGMTQAASKKYRKFDRVASALYKRFYDLADALPVKEIVPTRALKETMNEIAGREGRETIRLTSGEPMKGFGSDDVGEFLQQVNDLPGMITVEQARGLERTLNQTAKRAFKEGYDVSRLGRIKTALEEAKDNIDLTANSPEASAAVREAWDKANSVFAKSRRTFETTTAQKFGRVDRNIFGKGVFKPGSLNEDEVLALFNTRSLEALKDMRKIVGAGEFRRASRKYLDAAFQGSIRKGKEGAIVEDAFSAADFKKRLGLDLPEGRAAIEELLRGTGIKIREWDEFLEVAEKATDIVVRDPSTFLTRRIILGGGLMGGALIGYKVGGAISLPAAATLTWLARKGAVKLMDKNTLQNLTRALKDTTPEWQRRASLIRLVQAATKEEDTGRPQRP